MHCADNFHWAEKYPVRDMENGKVRAAGMALAMQGLSLIHILPCSDEGIKRGMISPRDIEAAICPETKAIVCTHEIGRAHV